MLDVLFIPTNLDFGYLGVVGLHGICALRASESLTGWKARPTRSHIQIIGFPGLLHNEAVALGRVFAEELGEDGVGFDGAFDVDPQ